MSQGTSADAKKNDEIFSYAEEERSFKSESIDDEQFEALLEQLGVKDLVSGQGRVEYFSTFLKDPSC